jgi:hypothetical protein
VSYVDAGYSIALGVLFLYAVALVLRRRRWERALRVAEQTEPMHTQTVPTNVEHRYAEHVEHAAHAAHAEEQTAPGARS